MNLTGKIGKAALWSAVGFVVWLVLDHYFRFGGLPSHDPLTNFFVFVAIGGAVSWFDQNHSLVWDWLWYGSGRKVLLAIAWVGSLIVLVTFPYEPIPVPLLILAAAFLLYQIYRLVMWVLF